MTTPIWGRFRDTPPCMTDPMTDQESRELPRAVTELLAAAEAALAAAADGHLVLSIRKRIWAALGPREVDGARAVIGPPLRRRTTLAIFAAQRVIPIWTRAFNSDERPKEMLRIARLYVEEKVDFKFAWRAKNAFWVEVDRLNGVAVAAGYAAAQAVTTALNDERFDVQDLDSKVDRDLDPYDWDASFFASVAAAHGAPWEASSDGSARREFWRWYIREAIRTAWMLER